MLDGNLRWEQDVELRVAITWLMKSGFTGIDQDVSDRLPYQIAYQIIRNPGDSVVIGTAKALEATPSAAGDVTPTA